MHVKKCIHFILYYFIVLPLLYIVNYIVFDLEVEGRENLKGIKGGVVICNHIHTLDCTMIGIAAFPRRATLVSQKENFEIPVAGWFVKHLGSLSTGKGYREKKSFYKKAINTLKNEKLVCIYPEGELEPYCKYIRKFKKGAFLIAAKTNSPIIPMRIMMRPCTGLRRIYRRKPLFSIHIEKPIYPKGNTMYEKSQYLYIESLKAMDKIVEQSYTADNLIREERPV